jgi:hypothetical protein
MYGENKHSLFTGLDLDLKGVQIAKSINTNNKLSEFIVASLYICCSENRFLMMGQCGRLLSIFLQILKLALWENCSGY